MKLNRRIFSPQGADYRWLPRVGGGRGQAFGRRRSRGHRHLLARASRMPSRIVEELVSNGAKAICRQLNVLAPPQDLPDLRSSMIQNRCIFTILPPRLFSGPQKVNFQHDASTPLPNIMLPDSRGWLQTLVVPAGGLQKIFYPSTTAINEISCWIWANMPQPKRPVNHFVIFYKRPGPG